MPPPTSRPRGALVSLLACLLLGTAALSGCSSLEGAGDKGYVTSDGQLELVAAADRGEPIDLEGEDLDGRPVTLADLRGRPVVVNVWWSACPPCRVEQPDLNDAAEELDDTAAFVGVNIRDSSVDQARAYVRSFEVPYPSVFSADGKALVPFYGTLTAYTVPATVVLDAEGRIAASILGRLPSKQTLLDVVADTAAEGTS
ncbi:TlpA disulfide reductase family protein [Nocardioides sp. P5_C9_2]